MYRQYKKVMDELSKVLRLLSVVLLAASFIVVFVQVFARYLFHTGKPWMEEFARYCVIWMVMFCSALAIRKGTHMNVDLLEQYLGKYKNGSAILNIGFDLIAMVFFVVMIRAGLKYMQSTVTVMSAGLRISMAYVYSAIPVGFFIMTLYIIEDIMERIHSMQGQKIKDGTGGSAA